MKNNESESQEIFISTLCLRLKHFNIETCSVSPAEFKIAESKMIVEIENTARMTGASLVEITKRLFELEHEISDKEKWYLVETIIKAGGIQDTYVGIVLIFMIKALGGDLEDKDFTKETVFRFCRAFNYRGDGGGIGGNIILAAETLLGFPLGFLEKELKR